MGTIEWQLRRSRYVAINGTNDNMTTIVVFVYHKPNSFEEIAKKQQ
jgi:hypothetical protein